MGVLFLIIMLPKTSAKVIAVETDFVSRAYGWMASALAVSGIVAFYIANYQLDFIIYLLSKPLFFYGLLIAELGLVIYLTARIQQMTLNTAILLFYLYAVSTGITFSVLFLIYTAASLASTFLITAGTFGAMALYGHYTKTDLTSVGNMLFMLLIGLIITSVVNIFLGSSLLYWITTFGGIFIFVGLTAYDAQKIKAFGQTLGESASEGAQKMAIIAAFSLYLDFINLFLYLLRLFGREK